MMDSLALLALVNAHDLPQRWSQPTRGDWANVLAGFPLFTDVSKRRLRKLAGNATLADFAPGEPIMLAGERSDSLYVILGGNAEAVENRARRALRTGDYFGEVAMIDGGPRSA